jgi:putative transposase
MSNNSTHNRRSIRLKGYDYSLAGGYFITIVTQLRKCLFGKITTGEMSLNPAGKMIHDEWIALQARFPNIETNVFQVMPNHFHGILILHDPEPVGATVEATVGATLVVAHDVIARDTPGAGTRPAPTPVHSPAPTVGAIVGAFKSITTHQYIQGVKGLAWPAFSKRLWQRNYYEHIIRDQADYERIAGYIMDNPLNWDKEDENLQRTLD